MICKDDILYKNIIEENLLGYAYYNNDWYLASICYWLLKEYDTSFLILFNDVIGQDDKEKFFFPIYQVSREIKDIYNTEGDIEIYPHLVKKYQLCTPYLCHFLLSCPPLIKSSDYLYLIETCLIKSAVLYANQKLYHLSYEKLIILHESKGLKPCTEGHLKNLIKDILNTLLKRLVIDEERLLFKAVHKLSYHEDRNTPLKAHSVIKKELEYITYFAKDKDCKRIFMDYCLTTGAFLSTKMIDVFKNSSVVFNHNILLLLLRMLSNYLTELTQDQYHRIEMDAPRIYSIGITLYSNILCIFLFYY